MYDIFLTLTSCRLLLVLCTLPQVLEANLANPEVKCGSAEVGGIWRDECRWPFKCCNTLRPAHTLTKHGAPISRASTASSVSTPHSYSTSLSGTTMVSQGGTPDSHSSVEEVAPPTPGSRVTRDPQHPAMATPKHTQVDTTTPARDEDKKAGGNAGHPINLP